MVTTKPARRDSAPRPERAAPPGAGQPARPRVGRRPGRGRGAGRIARQAQHQARGEALGAGPGDPDDGPDHPGGEGHAGQGPRAGRQGSPARSDRPVASPVVAALCVYPAMVPAAQAALAGSGVKVAAVATYFPSGQAPLEVKLADVRQAVKRLGADEIDMVIDRGAFLAGEYAQRLRRDRGRQGGLRRDAPEGDPGDRRARDLRQRAPRLGAGHGGRGRLHQDLAPARCSPPPPCR